MSALCHSSSEMNSHQSPAGIVQGSLSITKGLNIGIIVAPCRAKEYGAPVVCERGARTRMGLCWPHQLAFLRWWRGTLTTGWN